MDDLIVKVTELNPRLEKEIRDLLADMGANSTGFEGCELFARMDQAGHVLGVACTVGAGVTVGTGVHAATCTIACPASDPLALLADTT